MNSRMYRQRLLDEVAERIATRLAEAVIPYDPQETTELHRAANDGKDYRAGKGLRLPAYTQRLLEKGTIQDIIDSLMALMPDAFASNKELEGFHDMIVAAKAFKKTLMDYANAVQLNVAEFGVIDVDGEKQTALLSGFSGMETGEARQAKNGTYPLGRTFKKHELPWQKK